jgi:class 3 adenylate cyclase
VDASTALWEQAPEAMQAALRRHDALFEAAVAEHAGAHIRPRGEGDSRFAVFASAPDAVAAAVAIQRSFAAESWPTSGPLRVRIGLHTGAAEYRDGDYYGLEVNRCARVRSIGHGGQILLSGATALLVRDALPAELSLLGLGEHRLRHLTRPERIFQVVAPGLPAEFPRLQTLEAQVGDLPSGGERRELTVIFADLRGFTAWTEALEPQEVFAALNEYLTVMSDVIYDFQGTLDKFIADALVAFWGAPVSQRDHAGLACRAALRMVDELDRLNARWAALGRPPLAMSIGINSGIMLVGNLGSVSRFDYAVVGEAVNIGARLEHLNRTYGTNVLVGAATLERTSGLRARLVDEAPVGAMRTPISVFELLGDAAAAQSQPVHRVDRSASGE